MITVEQLKEKFGDVLLLDIREKDELCGDLGCIKGIMHIPMNDVPSRIDEIDKSKEVIIICRSGARAQHVKHFLVTHGFNAKVLEGGMIAWNEK